MRKPKLYSGQNLPSIAGYAIYQYITEERSPLPLKSVTLSLIHLKFASINKYFKRVVCFTTSLTDRMDDQSKTTAR